MGSGMLGYVGARTVRTVLERPKSGPADVTVVGAEVSATAAAPAGRGGIWGRASGADMPMAGMRAGAGAGAAGGGATRL